MQSLATSHLGLNQAGTPKRADLDPPGGLPTREKKTTSRTGQAEAVVRRSRVSQTESTSPSPLSTCQPI